MFVSSVNILFNVFFLSLLFTIFICNVTKHQIKLFYKLSLQKNNPNSYTLHKNYLHYYHDHACILLLLIFIYYNYHHIYVTFAVINKDSSLTTEGFATNDGILNHRIFFWKRYFDICIIFKMSYRIYSFFDIYRYKTDTQLY